MEKHVEGYLRLKIQRLGGMCLKWSAPGTRGVPDRVVFLPEGKIFFIETKAEVGGVLSPAQRLIHKLMKNLGITVFVLSSKEEVDSFIDGI